jgi:DNA-binding NtrC family response regulator
MRRILVFDDDPQICDLLEMALTETGCTVFRAGSLEHAEQILRHEPIRVLLIDTPMISFSGTKLGTYAAARGIKVLMMAAGEDAALRVRAAGLRYILKPFRIAQIADTVAAMLPSA